MLKINLNDLRVELITDWQSLSRFSRRWNEILAQTPGASPIQSFEWTESWWKYFGEGHRLYILIAIQGNQLVGIAPMMISEQKRNGRQRKILKFIGSANMMGPKEILFTLFPHSFLAEKSSKVIFSIFFESLSEKSVDWDVIEFPLLPEGNPLLLMIQKMANQNSFSVWSRSRAIFNKLDLADSKKIDKLLGSTEILESVEFFKKQGELLFWICKTQDDLENCLGHFFDHHISWYSKGSKSSSIFGDSPTLNPTGMARKSQDFLSEFARNGLQTGLIRIAIASLDQEPVAIHFGFILRNELIWGESALNPKFKKQHPDRMLLYYMIDYARRKKLKSIDMTEAQVFLKMKNASPGSSIAIFKSRFDYLWFKARARRNN